MKLQLMFEPQAPFHQQTSSVILQRRIPPSKSLFHVVKVILIQMHLGIFFTLLLFLLTVIMVVSVAYLINNNHADLLHRH